MTETFDIAGYCRISVDEELDRDNTSIENQKAIIADFVKEKFPGSSLSFFEDRDRSGYTFEQRESYQRMRKGLLNHIYDILVVKDFSRFSRRNSRGLVELEDLRDAGVRIISIGDGIDFPNDDDWLKIQFQFLINEMPVTDASKKVRAVVNRRQKDGKWICAAPYGYKINARQEFEVVPTEAEIVRKIFQLYIEGWGYKRIANYLTDEGIPTPRMSERERKEAEGKEYKRAVKPEWAIVSVQGILENDFYIGTLRQSKYTRKKINGKDVKKDEDEQIVIENHHQAIIEYRDFRIVEELRRSRSRSDYRGVKKYENTYTGFLVCGDCGSPMFSMSRPDLRDAYRCGTYHRRGLKGCTSHYIRVDTLDALLKDYLRKVRETSADMIAKLQADIQKQDEDLEEKETAADNMEEVLAGLQEELKIAKRQRVRDLSKRPQNEAIINQTYDEMEADIESRISALSKQIELTKDRENTIIRVNRAARTAIEVFDEILEKDKLDPKDLHLILDKIYVYEDHVEIKLKADIDSILRCGMLPEGQKEPEKLEESPVNFNLGTKDSLQVTTVQTSEKRPDKVFRANVICDGDPLEIFTDKDGELIFKKYSPIGELTDFAATLCDSLRRATDGIAAVCDRDAVIAVAGGGKRELLDRPISPQLAEIMEGRATYRSSGGGGIPASPADERFCLVVAAPILTEGDVMGCVLFLAAPGSPPATEVEYKLAQTAALFLGKQMEN
ncbi:MAG: stage V sporulation T C-terminal domain-containing protein [Eubacteriales bacterium]|nr:stage V sporulation T C-terminal domain-containing protein [Eubacteriales bacterium]